MYWDKIDLSLVDALWPVRKARKKGDSRGAERAWHLISLYALSIQTEFRINDISWASSRLGISPKAAESVLEMAVQAGLVVRDEYGWNFINLSSRERAKGQLKPKETTREMVKNSGNCWLSTIGGGDENR